jgi:hypothetical protein
MCFREGYIIGAIASTSSILLASVPFDLKICDMKSISSQWWQEL